jgi:hypothetical protein
MMRGETRSTRRKLCPSATLSTTNPTCTGTQNFVPREWPATNRMSHAIALIERRTVNLAICNTRAYTLTRS